MFPFDALDDTEVETEEKEEVPYREYEIDYETGQLTGRIVEGLEALKVWMYLALHTERYHYQQYSWDYGSELDTLIGGNDDPEYIELETKRMVEDCLTQNERITGVDSLKTEDGENFGFEIETDYGEVEIDV